MKEETPQLQALAYGEWGTGMGDKKREYGIHRRKDSDNRIDSVEEGKAGEGQGHWSAG